MPTPEGLLCAGVALGLAYVIVMIIAEVKVLLEKRDK